MPPGRDGIDALRVYRRMCVFRAFETTVGAAVAGGEIHGEMHLAIGHETVPAVLEQLLLRGDAAVSTHRAHLHALANGVDPVSLLAELRERDGLNHGKGGHMHLFDRANRFMCTGIVGASAPAALGYALAQRHRHEAGITVCALGDASMNQGAVFESLNLAAVERLPVLFLVENNDFGISVRRERSTAGALEDRAAPFGIPAFRADGRVLASTAAALSEAVAVVRGARRPALVVADVVRMRGHYEGDPDTYRSDEERPAPGSAADPLVLVRREILASAAATEAELREIEESAAAQVAEWDARSRLAPLPDPAEATRGVFVDE